MNSNQDPANPTIDELFQQLLDGELEDVDVFLSRLDDDEKLKHAADIQLVHSMLLHLSDRASGKNEQRVSAAIQRLHAETQLQADNPVVGRIGRLGRVRQFMASPLVRWAAAACIIFAMIIVTANIGSTANASLDRMIQAAAVDADRTYLITHDIGDGPPPSPFNAPNAGQPENINAGGDDNPDRKPWPSRKPSNDGQFTKDAKEGQRANDDKWEKMREYWEAKRKSQHKDDETGDRRGDGGRDDRNDRSDKYDRDRRDDRDNKGRDDRDGRDSDRDRDRDRDSDRKKWDDKRREGWGDRSRDDNRSSYKGKDSHHRGSRGHRPPFSFGPATLYVRGENQFVLKRPMPNGELIVGSNGKQSWIVGPSGPVYVSDDPRTLCAGPQGDLALPFLNISEGLDQLKKSYNIQKVADAPLPPRMAGGATTSISANVNDGRLYHRLDGTKHANSHGPNQVSIWADQATNIVQKVILDGFSSRHRHSFHPRRIVFDLESTDKLPSDFFEHTAHHEADREVKTRQSRSQYDRRR